MPSRLGLQPDEDYKYGPFIFSWSLYSACTIVRSNFLSSPLVSVSTLASLSGWKLMSIPRTRASFDECPIIADELPSPPIAQLNAVEFSSQNNCLRFEHVARGTAPMLLRRSLQHSRAFLAFRDAMKAKEQSSEYTVGVPSMNTITQVGKTRSATNIFAYNITLASSLSGDYIHKR